MTTSIAIVDYGMGNLRSVAQAMRHAAPEADVAIVNDPAAIRSADRVVLPGRVLRFELEGRLQDDGSRFKVPQMGWNRVRQTQAHALWDGIEDNAFFYFVHSYYVAPTHASHTAGETMYGSAFTSAVAHANIFATQFHPEKSADAGLRLYRNFVHWKP